MPQNPHWSLTIESCKSCHSVIGLLQWQRIENVEMGVLERGSVKHAVVEKASLDPQPNHVGPS